MLIEFAEALIRKEACGILVSGNIGKTWKIPIPAYLRNESLGLPIISQKGKKSYLKKNYRAYRETGDKLTTAL